MACAMSCDVHQNQPRRRKGGGMTAATPDTRGDSRRANCTSLGSICAISRPDASASRNALLVRWLIPLAFVCPVRRRRAASGEGSRPVAASAAGAAEKAEAVVATAEVGAAAVAEEVVAVAVQAERGRKKQERSRVVQPSSPSAVVKRLSMGVSSARPRRVACDSGLSRLCTVENQPEG